MIRVGAAASSPRRTSLVGREKCFASGFFAAVGGAWAQARRVRPRAQCAEIFATLDERGMLDGLPFMPEMLKYCGRTLPVTQRADKTCAGDGVVRRMHNTVHLEKVRCDGSAHDGCQAACLMFWKEAWLERVEDPSARNGSACTEPARATRSRPTSSASCSPVPGTRRRPAPATAARPPTSRRPRTVALPARRPVRPGPAELERPQDRPRPGHRGLQPLAGMEQPTPAEARY